MSFAMPSAYLRGCERVTGIVGRSASFRAAISPKIPHELSAIGAEVQFDHRAKAFCRHLRSRLAKIRQYEARTTDLLLFGLTRNNRREFDFLLKLLRDNGVIASSRLFLDDFRSRLVARSAAADEILERVLSQAKLFVSQRDLSGAHLWQLFKFTVSFMNIRASYAGKEKRRPCIAVVANDHSPAQVAFKAVMEELAVPVVYIQHAEVSPVFPPLDYAVSILRNRVSLDIYKQIGPITGEAFILSRSPDGNDLKRVVNVSTAKCARAMVGIYPTSRFEPKKVGQLLDKLKSNPAVDDYFIKLHPNSAQKLGNHEQLKYRVRTAIPSDPHIAIVGNSSVAIELLTKGMPVYQLFDLDEIERDYYGFVACGLTKEIVADQIEGIFWNDGFFDDSWLLRAGEFEPSIQTDQRKERARVAEYFDQHLMPAQKAKPTITRRLVNILEHIRASMNRL